jgi:O-Antigen ligase
LRLEERAAWSDESTRMVWRGLTTIVAVFGLIVVLGIATSKGGPHQFFHDAWHEFTKTSQDKDSDPARIVSSNSGNRWVWWKEAVGAWSDKPLQGWGGGSFPVTHLMYRKVELSVLQPHSVALQFLAETGVVGGALAMGSFAFLLFAALARIRRMTEGRERDIAVALFAGAVAWLLHGFVDFDWDIPGVTIPALLFLGVLVAVPVRREDREVAPLSGTSSAVAPRVAALALACVVLGLVIVSALLPEWADSKANAALAISTNAREPELRRASATAQTGSRLDPTAVGSLLAAADLAQNRGRLLDARRYLLQAVDRQPYNLTAWRRILQLALDTADRRGASAAAQRLLQLDPIDIRDGTLSLAGQASLFGVPAGSSPTATGTPLSPALSAAPATTPTPQTAGSGGTGTGTGTAGGTAGAGTGGGTAAPPPPPPAALPEAGSAG